MSRTPRFLARLGLLLLLICVAAQVVFGQEILLDGGQNSWPLDPQAVEPTRHQESVHLGRVTSGVMPADGLLSVGLGLRLYSTVYELDGFLQRIGQKDLYLHLESGPLPWVQVMAELPYRTWSGGLDWIPPNGSGVGDGSWQVTTGSSLLGTWLSGTLFGGGNLPMGSKPAGLTEGVFSPHAGSALTFQFWPRSQVPRLRLHLNLAYRWNRAEETGYGMRTVRFEPWFPRYQDAEAAGGTRANDYLSWGAALEFHKGTSTLWTEYWQDIFPDNPGVSRGESPSSVSTGVRWGVAGGWALHVTYTVSLALDDHQTDWYPAFGDLVYDFAVSRQFGIGGRDRDGDSVVDRLDHCPCLAEDHDGWRDQDGCPDYDNDADGVPDALDGDPDQPEDFDGFQDEDGVPDPDNDQDGIPDYRDLCPDAPEDFDGLRDDDGCPDDFLDTDGDGIEDRADSCPEVAEDLDGFEDDDGCPEPDNDLDGILDAQDGCPDEGEDYDGVDDLDGCPD